MLSGHHANVAVWRRQEALRRTLERRPDMLEHIELSKEDIAWINKLKSEQQQQAQSGDINLLNE
ncbi:tRNA (guanine-N(1)-)-methyltransferase [compost metagenome]